MVVDRCTADDGAAAVDAVRWTSGRRRRDDEHDHDHDPDDHDEHDDDNDDGAAAGDVRRRTRAMCVRHGLRDGVAQLFRQVRPSADGRPLQVPFSVLVRVSGADVHRRRQMANGREYTWFTRALTQSTLLSQSSFIRSLQIIKL